MLKDLFIFVIKLLVENNCEFICDLVGQILNVHDVPHLLFHPLFVLVLVAEVLILKSLSKFREHKDHFFELFTAHLSNNCVVLRSDRCTSWLLCKKTKFSEELRVPQRSDIDVFLLDRVLDEHLAFTTFDDVEVFTFFALINQRKLWIQKLQLNTVNKELHERNVLLEDFTVHGLLIEDELDNLRF